MSRKNKNNGDSAANGSVASVTQDMAKPRMARSAKIAELKLDPMRIPEHPSVTMQGTVDKIIPSVHSTRPETAQIGIAGARPSYRDLQIENTLIDEHGDDVKLHKGGHVEVTITDKSRISIQDSHANPMGHAMIDGTLDAVISQYDLAEEIKSLHKQDAWLQSTGPSSKALVKHPNLRIVLIAMRGKMSLPSHRTSSRISIQTIAGHVRVHLDDRTVDLPTGQLLVLDHFVSHDVESEKDSAFLLTLSWPPEDSGTHD